MAPRKREDHRGWPKGLRNIPDGSHNWYWSVYDRQRRPQRKKVPLDASSYGGARREAILLQARYDQGEFDPWRQVYRAEVSAGEALEAYMQAHLGQAPSTLKNKRSLLGRLVRYAGPGVSVRAVRAADVEAFCEKQQRKSSAGWAESTLQANLTRIGGFFAWLEAERYIDENPAYEYKKSRSRSRRGYRARRKTKSKRLPIFPQQLARITQLMREKTRESPYADAGAAADAFELAMATGLRRAELCALCRRDVRVQSVGDYAVTGQLRVRPWKRGTPGTPGHESFYPKNERAARTVPLTPRAALLASKHLEAATDEDAWAPLIRAPRGGRLDPDTLSQQFRSYRIEAGLSDRITLHSTRHGFISVLAMLRIGPYLVRDIAGHADLRVQSRYVSFAEEHMSGRAAEARQRALEWLCPGAPPELVRRLVGRHVSSWRSGQLDPLRQSGSAGGIEEALFGGLFYREDVRSKHT